MADLDIKAAQFTGANEFFKLSYDIRHRETFRIPAITRNSVSCPGNKI